MTNEEFVKDMRGFCDDHDPNGWPAIRMREITRLCDIIDGLVPALDILQKHLAEKATIDWHPVQHRWCLHSVDGSAIVSGATIREMLVNLMMCDDAPHNLD